MTRRIALLLLVVEETDDAAKPPPPVIDVAGETLSETTRPLAKALPANVVPFRKAVGS